MCLQIPIDRIQKLAFVYMSKLTFAVRLMILCISKDEEEYLFRIDVDCKAVMFFLAIVFPDNAADIAPQRFISWVIAL